MKPRQCEIAVEPAMSYNRSWSQQQRIDALQRENAFLKMEIFKLKNR